MFDKCIHALILSCIGGSEVRKELNLMLVLDRGVAVKSATSRLFESGCCSCTGTLFEFHKAQEPDENPEN